jgi:NAD(P)-dependent dehydrogenase (short-subunit alcohol dehydrogenase family)
MQRTALVTGANRGIGLATCQGLREGGLRVIVAARQAEDAAAAASELGGEPGAEALALDLADPRSVERALASLGKSGMAVDVLVNNAGVYLEGALLAGAEAALRESLEVHLLGPLALARALLPPMIARGWGRVVNVSSGYGSFAEGLEGPPAYSISKAALGALTVKLAQEVSGDVKVNAVCPGWVRTRMGGPNAERGVELGAETIVWLATLPASGPNGGFFRDRRPIAW